MLGTRLGVTEDTEALDESLGEEDPRLPLLWVYDWLELPAGVASSTRSWADA